MEEKKKFNFDWQVALSVLVICVLIVSSVAIVFVAFDNDNGVAFAYNDNAFNSNYDFHNESISYISSLEYMSLSYPIVDFDFDGLTYVDIVDTNFADDTLSVDSVIPVYYGFTLDIYTSGLTQGGFVEILSYTDVGSTNLYRVGYYDAYELEHGVSLSFSCYSTNPFYRIVITDNEQYDFTVAVDTELDMFGFFNYTDYANQLIQDGYEEGYDEGVAISFDEGYNAGLDEGRDEGYSLGFQDGATQGFNEGYETGYQSGYNYGLLEEGDFSWYGLVSSVFDAPLRILIGTWERNEQGEYELVGGMLNFDMPGLNVNFAPVLTSLFTLVILIVILRFVFSAIL